MPRIWTDTIETHRRAVQEAAIDATGQIVAERGLLSVSMSQIAEKAGIGRATLYKHFPDLESLLRAWHERQVASHLDLLAAARDRAQTPAERLDAVLATYARIAHESRGHNDHSDVAALLHRRQHVIHAHQRLHVMVRDLLGEAAHAGHIRADISPGELATYCLHALTAASALPSNAAVSRLVAITLAGLNPR